MDKRFDITVIGGGNGAFAAAAHLSHKGLTINICDPYRDGEGLSSLQERGHLSYCGVLGEGEVQLNIITSHLELVVPEAKLLLICVPSTAHEVIATQLAPFLRPGMVVLLNPGHSGGALHFQNVLKTQGFLGDIILGETNTLTYVARKVNPTTISITNVAGNIHVAALPASNITSLLEAIRPCYPNLRPTRTIMGTTLRNLNAMMHPPGMILGAAWIEATGGDFTFYYDAATVAVARLMHAIDAERMDIAEAWDEPMEPLIDLLADIGTTTEKARQSGSLRDAFLESEPNREIRAPSSLDDRYMNEDFPFGLVPIVALGNLIGVESPMMESLIRVASVINNVDYWTEGRNLERLGLGGMSVMAVKSYLRG